MSNQRSPSSIDSRKVSSIRRRRIRNRVLEKYSYKCIRCNSVDELTLDHIIEAKNGGRFKVDNLQVLCYDCNQLKSNPYYDKNNRVKIVRTIRLSAPEYAMVNS